MTESKLYKRPITNTAVLNEAYHYQRPSAFSRGIRVELNGASVIYISGTAAINERGESVHIGDFKSQIKRTFANIAALLESENCHWRDVVRTTCYLRDIDRDYATFNIERSSYFEEIGLAFYPASTCIEARLCRPELLVEIEAIAMTRSAAFPEIEFNSSNIGSV